VYREGTLLSVDTEDISGEEVKGLQT